ncbi:MAG: hypothetical protein ACTIJ8_06515, partial [Sphingobacterium sp.]
VKLFSVPNRPVLTLNIQLASNIDFRFGEFQSGQSKEGECQLFWQGDQTVVQHLVPGEYSSLDIFFEDTMVPDLKIDEKKIRFWQAGLADTPESTSFHSARLTKETKVHIKDIIERIRSQSFSGSEFFLTCINLLTYYFKEKRKYSRLSLERILYTFPFNQAKKARRQLRSELYHYRRPLERMRGLDRSRLEERFLYLRGKVVPKLDHFDWAGSMILYAMDPYLLRLKPETRDALLDFYYGTTKLLADRLSFEAFSDKDREWVRICIFTLISAASELKELTESQAGFVRSLGLSGNEGDISNSIYRELIENREGCQESNKLSKPNILRNVRTTEIERIGEAKVCPIRSPDTVRIYARLRQGLEKYAVLFQKEWHKIGCEINRAYIEDDHHELLLFEIRYLSKLPGYLDKVDTDTLCWYQIVLKTEFNELTRADPDLVRLPGYPLVHLHGMLEQWALSKFVGFRPRVSTIDQVLENINRVFAGVLLSRNRELLYSLCGMVNKSFWR